MTYHQLMFLHLGTVIPAFLLGTIILLTRKGTNAHKFLGRIYMILMLITALITLFMSAEVGPTLFNHFGYLHLFSFLTFYTVPTAYLAAKKGDINSIRINEK